MPRGPMFIGTLRPMPAMPCWYAACIWCICCICWKFCNCCMCFN